MRKLTALEKKQIKDFTESLPAMTPSEEKRLKKFIEKYPVPYHRGTIENMEAAYKRFNESKKSNQNIMNHYDIYETGMKYIEIMNKAEKQKTLPQTFDKIFINELNFLNIKNLLIQEKLINEVGNRWLGNRILFVGIVKALQNENLLISVPNITDSIIIIAKNSFDMVISERTAKSKGKIGPRLYTKIKNCTSAI